MNKLKTTDYLSQRNNRENGKNACNTTMISMMGLQANQRKIMDRALDFWNEKYETNYLQWEDSLYYHIGKINPNSKYPPQEDFSKLVDGANDWIGESIFKIDWGASLYDIEDYSNRGYGVGFCGYFPNTSGHFVNLGFMDSNKAIINDPWGNYHTKYEDFDGYNIDMPLEDFINFRFNKKETSMRFYIFLGKPNNE